MLSLMHAAGGAERNWSTHGKIFADDRQSQTAATLQRNVRMFRNMRLRDHTLSRGKQAKKDKEKEPKENYLVFFQLLNLFSLQFLPVI